ncbi:MAG: winged helix-turn-helix transcriptional regulator, partial [Spirochaetaceae bacterium]|nr:winged helix-turn-helix transcriptional regulator [Spirochaetaceae bacterium]
MRLILDPSSTAPLFKQVAAELRERCRSGASAPGTRLPSTRALAEELGVSRITTEGAYAELEAEALVERRPGSGTYVARRGGAGDRRAYPGSAGGRYGAAAEASKAAEPALPPWQAEFARGGPASGIEPGLGMGGTHEEGVIDFSSGLADPAL